MYEPGHAFIAAVDLAFNYHYPLSISPDMLWLLIAQGFAQHVTFYAEELRHLFVDHQGKETVTIRRDDFVKGKFENPWPEAFSEFSGQMQQSIKQELYQHLVPQFSTTGTIEKAAFEVAFMDTLSSYFEQVMWSMCGIPEITLEGLPEDWEKLAHHLQQLRGYGLDWWIDQLMLLLKKIIDTAHGSPDVEFWESFYKYDSMSGGPFISGWVLHFFPYLVYKHDVETFPEVEKCIQDYEYPEQEIAKISKSKNSIDDEEWEIYVRSSSFIEIGREITTYNLSSGISKVDFKWVYHFTQSFDMQLLAGFMGVYQDPETLALRPEIGWAVREK